MDEKERFEKAMIKGGFKPPVRSRHAGYVHAEDEVAWEVWNLAVAAEREYCAEEFARLKELERRVAKRCAEAVPQWAPELRELLRPSAESDRE